MKFPNINIIVTNLISGGYEFNNIIALRITSRIPEYSMTTDPEKVWPGGTVHYVIDSSLGKFLDFLNAQCTLVQSTA